MTRRWRRKGFHIMPCHKIEMIRAPYQPLPVSLKLHLRLPDLIKRIADNQFPTRRSLAIGPFSSTPSRDYKGNYQDAGMEYVGGSIL